MVSNIKHKKFSGILKKSKEVPELNEQDMPELK